MRPLSKLYVQYVIVLAVVLLGGNLLGAGLRQALRAVLD